MLSCRLLTVLAAASLISTGSAATDFGYTTSSDKYVISTGAGLTISMRQSTCDIVSINYNGKELQYKSMGTHVNSGLGSGTTSKIEALNDDKKTVHVNCKKTGLEQNYFFRPNENSIYMGTYHSNGYLSNGSYTELIGFMIRHIPHV